MPTSNTANLAHRTDATESATSDGFSLPSLEEKPRFVFALFQRLARYYDVMNDVMTMGLHRRWKASTAARVAVPASVTAPVLLDLCCGTGDLSRLLHQRFPQGRVLGFDFSPEMLTIAHDKSTGAASQSVQYQVADALSLPLEVASIDGITIGYGLRNVGDYRQCLAECFRVLKPGASLVILDMSHPVAPMSWLTAFYRFHVLPLVGRFLAKDDAAYRYLTHSIFFFPTQKVLLAMLGEVGFIHAKYQNLMGGVCAIHEAQKPTV